MRLLFIIMMLSIGYARIAIADDAQPDAAITHIYITPDAARNELNPETGSSTYVINNQAIDNLPQGNFTPLNDVLLQAPGVAQDSYGQLHVRGDHADLQYRINGIIIPEGISGFGQTLDTHFADKITFITGALPAQYGYRTAGIVDITTKSGDIGNGGETGVQVGSNDSIAFNQSAYMSSGMANVFFTGSYEQNNRGVEPPTSGFTPIHDDTTQDKEFGYLSYAFNPEQRLSVIVGNSTNRFEIPNNPGQAPAYNLSGTSDFPSSSLNENQYEHNTYGIAALQGSVNENIDYQLAFFARASSVLYKPDPVGDLIYDGIASRDLEESTTEGLQNDFSYHLNDTHTLRAGWMYSYEQTQTNSDSFVFPCCDISEMQTSNVPFDITDNSSKNATLFGTYLQDEWRATDKLTINYGTRFDAYDAYVSEVALSPRLGAVYDITSQTQIHGGYARYFTPPATELISSVSINNFTNTTGALASSQSSPVRPEKDNYFDLGVTQKVNSGLTLGVDSYYKQAHDLLDEGQFGQALIYSPFNYEKGWVRGVELTADYNHGPLSAYSNLAISKAMGKDVASGQYNFTQAELDYISSNAVHLDHDQLFSGSAGTSYKANGFTYGTDMLYGSGLRDGDNNTGHLPFYTQVNASVGHDMTLGDTGEWKTKLSALNVFDRVYEIRDGSGIGVFAPQYGIRRTVFLELSKPF